LQVKTILFHLVAYRITAPSGIFCGGTLAERMDILSSELLIYPSGGAG